MQVAESAHSSSGKSGPLLVRGFHGVGHRDQLRNLITGVASGTPITNVAFSRRLETILYAADASEMLASG
jgi:hypothetical protein